MITGLSVDVIAEEALWAETLENLEDYCKEVASFAFNKIVGEEKSVFNIKKPCQATILLTNDENIREINKEYRGMDKATNVLSFAAFDSLSQEIEDAEMQTFDEIMLGDIAIAYQTTKREALEQDKDFKAHFTHLIIHGILHILGFDHIEDEDAEVMEALEIKILSDFGIANPYTY